MSYRFNNGLILRNCSLEVALEKAKVLRRVCLEKASEKLCQRASEYLVLRHDLAMNVCWLDDEDHPSVMKEIDEAQRITVGGGGTSPDWDYTLELVFIPWFGNLLVLYYLENDPGYRDAMLSLGFEDFHYYNNVDKPESVPEWEWKARRDAWFNCGLTDYEAPSSLGMCFKVVSWNDLKELPVWWLNRTETVMSPQNRRKAVARELVAPEVVAYFNGKDLTPTDFLMKSWSLADERAEHVLLADDESLELDFHDFF